MLTFLEFAMLLEGRSFVLNGKKYSSGFGHYTCNGKSITKDEYELATANYQQSNQMIRNDEFNEYKPQKNILAYEEYLRKMTGMDINLGAASNKTVADVVARSVYTIYTKYPKLFNSKSLKSLGSTTSLKHDLAYEYYESWKNDTHYMQSLNKNIDKMWKYNNIGADNSSIDENLVYLGITPNSKDANEMCAKIGVKQSTDKITPEIVKNLRKHYTDYCIRKQAETYVSKLPIFSGTGNFIAYYHYNPNYSKGIYINNKVFNDYIKSATRHIIKSSSGDSPKGTDKEFIIIHEFGHAIDNLLNLRENEEIKKIYNELDKETIAKELSLYATTDIKEFIAEAFGEYHNSKTPRKIATQIGTIVERLYKDYEGEN